MAVLEFPYMQLMFLNEWGRESTTTGKLNLQTKCIFY